MRVYFIRHGERPGNQDDPITGEEVPLTEYGKEQAALLAERFAGFGVGRIYSSPYVRAKQTAEIVNVITKTEIVYNDLLKEISKGEKVTSVWRRAMQFVEFPETEVHEECIIVSAHSGIIKMIIFEIVFGEALLEPAFEAFNRSLHMHYTGITLCRFDGKRPWQLVTWNDLGHLPPPK